jgi:hypothetical protein
MVSIFTFLQILLDELKYLRKKQEKKRFFIDAVLVSVAGRDSLKTKWIVLKK